MKITVEFEQLDIPFDVQFGDWLPASPAAPNAVLYTEQKPTPEQQAQARKNIGAAAVGEGYGVAADEKYFDIDDDGLLSLKPAYRAVGNGGYKYSISDNGVNKEGSLMSELPDVLVIPEVVNEIAVTNIAPAMFYNNTSIRKLILPKFIKTIPASFCDGAFNLREVIGTENVEVINQKAFQWSGLEQAYFPKLKNLAGVQVFNCCPLMTSAEIGDVTDIPKMTFCLCEKLSTVRTNGKVVTVGERAFAYTRRLKNLSLIPNLTRIDTNAFMGSRVIYEWDTLTNCTFGENATSAQYNPTDYWSACTFTPCKTELRSVHDQKNPLWSSKKIGDTTLTYAANGCNAVVGAAIYSVYEQKDLASPEEFVEAVRAANPSLMILPVNEHPTIQRWFEALGYTVDCYYAGSKAAVQAIYDALAQGYLILSSSVIPYAVSGHSVVLNGITENGELIACDTSAAAGNIGVYSSLSFTTQYQNFIVSGPIYIIHKPEQKEV